MGKSRFVCEYCNKSFKDSHEARQRHNRGRNHKANVKLWYDSFADHERHASAATSVSSGHTLRAWTPVNPPSAELDQRAILDMQNLPPSMHPAPPGAFYYCQADWG
ncbi:unnamed protein product [Peronospora belbahrii]|uniref:Matrin-type domain-containing protein n=1 Tax=Peronospora belbahrii TaxID=622444 RepID=A0AAU9L9Q5_9STRA|nr:unnamed protein product [Peronospora belbahrii]CAH0519086.1 unnamed protein product [Peronospora belbahrii]